MEADDKATELTAPPKFDLLFTGGEYKDIIRNWKHFPGTAALMEELEPYLDHKLKEISTGNTSGAAASKFIAPTADYSHLPAMLAKEVREHLGLER